jgi:hypothetical protein
MRGPALAALALALLAACDRGPGPLPPDPNYREPMVNGYLYRVEFYDRTVSYERDVAVIDNQGLRMVPVVRLNDEYLRPYEYNWNTYKYGDENWFGTYRYYELNVEHYWGEAFSRIVMPGNFTLTNPPGDSYILDMESTLVVTWNRSSGAQWYWIDVYASYDFLDSSYVWDDYEFEMDTTVSDTFLVLPPGRVFPSYIMDVLEGDGSALVWAGYGPPVEPGDRGNVRGNGYGFFNGFKEPREKYFWVGAPIAGRVSAGAAASLAKLRERLALRAAQY